MKKSSVLMITAAGVMWGLMGVFVRRLNSMGLSSPTIAFIRAFFTSIVIAAFILIYDKSLFRIKLRDIWIFAGGGLVSILLFNICYFKAIEIMSLSAAAILMYTAPAFVLIISAVVFKEKITAPKITAIVLTIAGCALVGGIMSGDARITIFGLVCGLGSGFGYAMYSIFSRFAIMRGYNSITITFYIFLFAMLGACFIADMREFASVTAELPARILYYFLYVIVITVLPYFLYTAGLKNVENSTASVIAAVEPVVATILGIILYSETLTFFSALGVILVIAGIVIMGKK